MSLQTQKSSIFVLLLLILLITAVSIQQLFQASAAAAVEGPLFTPVSLPDNVQDDTENAIRHRYVTVNTDKLQYLSGQSDATLTFQLFEDTLVSADQQKVTLQDTDRFVWAGQYAGSPSNNVMFSVQDDVVMGTINWYNTLYRLSYVGDGVHKIEQLPWDYRSGAEPLLPAAADISAQPPAANITGMNDDGSMLDVMVVYTPAAKNRVGGTNAMEALIDLAIAETNQGYDSSQINFDIQLVHAAEVNYTEASTNEFSTALNHVTGKTDGQIDQIHQMRDAYNADLVVLLIDGAQYCGIAWLMTNESAYFEANGFSVTDYSCATGYYSFAHEIGHNMGSTHDRANASGGVFPYSFGYQDPGANFRTIMAYNCPSGCTRVNHWSNPNITYSNTGLPTGVNPNAGNSAANYLSLNNTIDTVANFRQSSESATPTPTATATATPTNTPSPTPTNTPTATPTPIPTTQTTVPTYGGTIEIAYLTISVPANAFAETIELEFNPISASELPSRSPSDNQANTRDYQFELIATYTGSGLPAEPQGDNQYAMTINYNDSSYALSLMDEATLQLYYWDATAQEWQLEASAVLDTDANTIEATLDYFGMWALFGEGPDKVFLPFVAD